MDSPITNLIERGLTSFWRVPKVSYIEKNDLYRLQFGYKSCYSFTNMAFRVQKLRFAYKYLIVNLQNCISNYKVASRIATQHAKGKELDVNTAVSGISIPFHPGAEKYYKEAGALK